MTFEKWLDKVDEVFIKVTGLDRDTWPDQDYWSMFDAGDSPREAVFNAIENEYGDAGLEAFGLEIA
jgi:hypothetical protein